MRSTATGSKRPPRRSKHPQFKPLSGGFTSMNSPPKGSVLPPIAKPGAASEKQVERDILRRYTTKVRAVRGRRSRKLVPSARSGR